MRDLDTFIQTELFYDNAVSERPQDGSQIEHQDTLIFDQEYDLNQASFSLHDPIKSEAYSQWLSDFINDDLNFFTKEEETIIEILFRAHYRHTFLNYGLNRSYWDSLVDHLNNL